MFGLRRNEAMPSCYLHLHGLSRIGIAIAVLTCGICNAQSNTSVKFQCDGKYSNFANKPPMLDVPVQGLFVEISDDKVTIVGAPGFEATYSVTLRREDGVGFVAHSNESYGGFLNRFSGQLTLKEDIDSKKVRQLISATCRSAKSLF